MKDLHAKDMENIFGGSPSFVIYFKDLELSGCNALASDEFEITENTRAEDIFQEDFERIISAIKRRMPLTINPCKINNKVYALMLLPLEANAAVVSLSVLSKTMTTYSSWYINSFLNFSLELKRPLVSLMAGIRQLSKRIDKDEKETLDCLAHVNHDFHNMSRISANINEIVLSLFQQNRVEIQCHNLTQVIGGVVTNYKKCGLDQRVPISFESGAKNLLFSFDRYKMERVLYNLLSNSVSNTRPDNQISIKVAQKDKKVTITVADRGQGIHHKKLTNLFDLYTVDEDKLFSQNCSLGIAYIYAAMESMGGSVLINSMEGKGTTVTLSMPYDPNFTQLASAEDTPFESRMGVELLEFSAVLEPDKYQV